MFVGTGLRLPYYAIINLVLVKDKHVIYVFMVYTVEW